MLHHTLGEGGGLKLVTWSGEGEGLQIIQKLSVKEVQGKPTDINSRSSFERKEENLLASFFSQKMNVESLDNEEFNLPQGQDTKGKKKV